MSKIRLQNRNIRQYATVFTLNAVLRYFVFWLFFNSRRGNRKIGLATRNFIPAWFVFYQAKPDYLFFGKREDDFILLICFAKFTLIAITVIL